MRPLLRLLVLLAVLLAPASAYAGSPRVAIFFYPWYSTDPTVVKGHWIQNGHEVSTDIASNYFPLRGPYSSADPTVVDAQMDEIASTGAGVVVSSWWGVGSQEDTRLPAVIAAAQAHLLTVAVQIENYEDRTAATVDSDIDHLVALGITDIYVYRAQDVASATDWAAIAGRHPTARLIAHTVLAGWAAKAGFKGIYTYDVLIYDGGSFRRLCTQAHRLGLLCAPSVGPGFDARAATGESRSRPRRQGKTYDAMWLAAVNAGADIVTVTSYNEWHEGTQIEPAAADVGPSGRYASYEGAWGLHGARAATAYLARTALWAQRLDPVHTNEVPAAVARILAAWPDQPRQPSRAGGRASRMR